jgi:sigma-B regulation protein RsbU (phosphoserine phosphatase)
MADRSLIVAYGDGPDPASQPANELAQARAETLASAIVSCWPAPGARPSIRTIPIGSVLLERGLCQAPVVIMGDASLTGSRLTQLLDALDGRCVPAVLLLDRPALAQLGDVPGIVTMPSDVPPGVIAPVLYALGQRQHTVERLATELAVAHHCQGGMHGEISRMHEELSLAARIQRDFMPRAAVRTETFDIAVLYQPTGYVSGDMYSVRGIDERTVGILVADAVGHGVPAALLTMVIARSVQSAPAHIQRDPSAMLARLNTDLMVAQSGSTRFVTAIYATLDLVTNRARVAGAGHPPPFHITRRGVERVETDGPLLGVFDDATFGVTDLTLGPAETLLIYTDGFETCFPKAGATNHELRMPTTTYVDHFARLCAPESAATLEEAMAELRATLTEQAGSLHQADDVTALAIAAKEAGASRRAA